VVLAPQAAATAAAPVTPAAAKNARLDKKGLSSLGTSNAGLFDLLKLFDLLDLFDLFGITPPFLTTDA
jgi:hypothetical protein